MQLLQHFPPLVFKFYLLFCFWYTISLKGLFSVLGRALFTFLQKRGWLSLAISSPWYLCLSPLVPLCCWLVLLCDSQSLLSASLNSLCSACRMHSLTFSFCQPILNMLTSPSPGGKPWDSYSCCFPSEQPSENSFSFSSAPATFRSVSLLHASLFHHVLVRNSVQGWRELKFYRLSSLPYLLILSHFQRTIADKFSSFWKLCCWCQSHPPGVLLP